MRNSFTIFGGDNGVDNAGDKHFSRFGGNNGGWGSGVANAGEVAFPLVQFDLFL